MTFILNIALFAMLNMQSDVKQEDIFSTAPFASCHASTIVELRNGDLLAAWFGGSAEGKPDVAIWGSRRANAPNARWSAPFELARESNIAAYNPVLFYTNDNKLWLYYKFGPHPTSWTAGRMWSADDGKSWSPREHLPAGLYGPVRAKPLVMDDGTIVSGTSVESYHSWACWIERSTDRGKTWSKIGPINVSLKEDTRASKRDSTDHWDWNATDGIIQPSVVSLGGNRLRLYARSTASIGKICIADSSDGGLTWTQASTIELPNPNSGIDAVTLKDGRILLIYNHSKEDRSPLNLAISKDGTNFTMIHTLESQPGEYSYPSIIQGKNGDVHITYTWNRKRIRYVRIKAAGIAQ